MPKGICHAKGCGRLMENHSLADHLDCSIRIAEEHDKKHEKLFYQGIVKANGRGR
jgi:hypothetical protein